MLVQVQLFFYCDSNIFSYLVSDLVSGEVVLIDLVLDYDLDIDVSSELLLCVVLQVIEWEGLQLCWLLEIYVYVDYVLVGCWFKQCFLQVMLVIGEGICVVQVMFVLCYGLQFLVVDEIFDYLFSDGEIFVIGEL